MARYDKLDPNATHKVCTKCKEDKIMDLYHNSKKSADGKQSRCKDCCQGRMGLSVEERAKLTKKQEEMRATYGGEKECPWCNQVKPLSEFYKNKNSKDGLTVQCRDHIKAATKAMYDADPDAYNTRSREWYYNNRDKHKASTQRWRDANREKVLHYNREYMRKRRNGEV